MSGPKISASGPPSAGTANIAVTTSIAPVKPLKIKSLTLCNFRAFAGPEPVRIDLDGKNLLIYGENGAGKSSIFHALDEFFSTAQANASARRERLKTLKNIFSKSTDDDAFVEVELDDGAPAARWDNKSHPVDAYPAEADARIVNGSYRKAILDYRALLETNYRHGAGAVNLFDVCVRVLLRDYPAIHSGKEERLFDLWKRAEPFPTIHRMTEADLANIKALTSSVNAAIGEAIEAMAPKVNALLGDFGWGDVKLEGLEFTGVSFHWNRYRENRKFLGCDITPKLLFRDAELTSPQTFLNEARLSALALAIYFAGRQLCAATLQANTPRLMVLDDVLIGLDHSNRMPVLQVIDNHFNDWQIVLLTHDRVWYEMARFHLADRTDWAAMEMFEEKQPNGASMPIAGPVKPFVKPKSIDAIADNIATARKFHGMREYAAAAVHARIAFELSLKNLCDRKAIPVRFHTDARQLTTEQLLTAIENWLGDTSRTPINALVHPAIKTLKLWRKVVLNPFSHSTPVSLTDTEVEGAIDAVEALQQAFKDHIFKK